MQRNIATLTAHKHMKGGTDMDTLGSNRGTYATACEKSPHKQDIDKWMNEGKSNLWISKQLTGLGEKISDKSIAKYRQYRDEHLNKELMKDPVYQAQIQKANDTLIDEVGKFKQINVLNHLSETIEHCASLIGMSIEDDVRIKNVQDLRFVQMTMLDALKLYTDTIMKAQQYAKIEDDPTLIKPTVNMNVKNVLVDMLGGMTDEQRFAIVDRIRRGSQEHDTGGLPGDNVDTGSSELGRTEQDT